MTVLEVEHLKVAYRGQDQGDAPLETVRDVSFAVAAGESLGVVGESGCGKSQSMLAVLRMLAPAGVEISGRVTFDGKNLTTLTPRQMRTVRGSGIGLAIEDADGRTGAIQLMRHPGRNEGDGRAAEIRQYFAVIAGRNLEAPGIAALRSQQNEQPRIGADIGAAGSGRAGDIPEICHHAMPIAPMRAADHRKAVDPVGHAGMIVHEHCVRCN